MHTKLIRANIERRKNKAVTAKQDQIITQRNTTRTQKVIMATAIENA